MPYSSPNDAPDYVPSGKRAQWVAVWNSAHEKAKKEGKSDKEAEESAFAQANGVAGPKPEKAMTLEQFGSFTLTKADARTRTVYGIAAAEVPDKVGEIFDYETSKPLIKAWSDERFADSGGKSKGNIREQHTSRAIGKLTDLTFNDSAKQVEVIAALADDEVWEKVEQGIYAGFSFGGRYEKRWTDAGGLRRYTARPFELTVCDNPCIPGAAFQMVKADGSTEMRKFAKASTGETKKEGVKYLVHDGDKGHLPYTGTDGKPNHRLMGAAWAALHGGYRGNTYEGPEKQAAISKLKGVYESEGIEPPGAEKLAKLALRKGLWDVSRLADILESLGWMQECLENEAEYERDNSPIPGQLKEWIGTGVGILTALVAEEGAELIQQVSKSEGESMDPKEKELFSKLEGRVDELEKMSKAQKNAAAKIHEHHAAMGEHLQTMMGVGDDDAAKAAKAAKDAELAKAGFVSAGKDANGVELFRKADGNAPSAEVTALRGEVSELSKNVLELVKGIGEAVAGKQTAKSDLPAMAKSADGAAKSQDDPAGKQAEGERKLKTATGLEFDANDFSKSVLAKPISNPELRFRQ